MSYFVVHFLYLQLFNESKSLDIKIWFPEDPGKHSKENQIPKRKENVRVYHIFTTLRQLNFRKLNNTS